MPTNAVAQASVIVEEGSVAQDVGTKATALAAEAGIASASADPGQSGIVEIDIVADADAGTKAVDDIDAGEASDGTYTIGVDGVATAPLDHDADAAAVAAALEALPNVNDVTVTGAGTAVSPFNVTIDDPVGPHAITFTDVDLVGPSGTEGVTEDTAGVAPSASAGATAITDAITAVDDVQLRDGAVDSLAPPVPAASSATPSISTNDAIASVDITTTVSAESGIVELRLFYVSSGVVTGIPSGVRYQFRTNGTGRIIFNGNGALADGTYVFVVEAIDANDRRGYEVITLTVSNQS